LVPDDIPCEQLSFFGGGQSAGNERQEQLENALDGIRSKFGRNAVAFGSILQNDIGIEEHVEEH
jgi:DNA polymerase IV